MNTLVHFLLSQSYRSLKKVSLGGPHIPFLGLIKRSSYGWLNAVTSLEILFSALPRAPNLKSTTDSDGHF